MLFLTLFSYRYDSNSGGEREIQRTMLELLNQLDGFDSRGDVKVIMATNRIETLDPALIRPGKRLPAVGSHCWGKVWCSSSISFLPSATRGGGAAPLTPYGSELGPGF